MEMACLDVCPLAAELSVIHKNVTCPEEGCGKVFQATSALNMHLTKHHRNSCLAKKDANVTVRYFCPEEKCVYHPGASRHFSQMKYLKQHYLKVHSEKKYGCASCKKAFPTEDLLRHHYQTCGIKFTCSCGNNYGSYEALLTHSKRKQHVFDDKYKFFTRRFKLDNNLNNLMDKMTGAINVDQSQTVYILPKASSEPVNILAAVALTELSGGCSSTAYDKALQTDIPESTRKKLVSFNKTMDRPSKRRATVQTQTGGTLRNLYPKKSAETQTIGDYILQKAMQDAEVLPKQINSVLKPQRISKRKKSMETQTTIKRNPSLALSSLQESLELTEGFGVTDRCFIKENAPFSSSCCSPAMLPLVKDVGLSDLWYKNTSSTQTSPTPIDVTATSQGIVNPIQTDLNLELFEQDSNLCPSNNLPCLGYFEDNCDSLDNVSSDPHFDRVQDPSSESIIHLESFSTEASLENRSCNIETQTELDLNCSFFSQCASNDDSPLTLCSTIETQTTNDFQNLDELLYANMCTQTGEDALFSDLDFVDIQTQTAWPTYQEVTNGYSLVTAETQTAISSCNMIFDAKKCINNEDWSRDAECEECQTNIYDYKNLIAELDS